MTAELLRLLENVLRQGVIFAVDEKSWRVRVKSGELETDWLRWNTARAGAFSIWLPPAVGEQVWLGCLGGNPETAFILGSVYSSHNPAPGSSLSEIVISAPDGARFRYDAAAGDLTASGMQTARLQAAVSITLDTPQVVCSGLLQAKTFELSEGGAMRGTITHSDGAFSSNGVQLDSHAHGGIERGGSWTEGTK